MNPRQLFVYGTLRRGGSSHWRLARHSDVRFLSEAYIYGRLYPLRGYPVAVQSNHRNCLVAGELFDLAQNRDILQDLDRYEGCHPECLGPCHFVRKVTHALRLPERIAVETWAYFSKSPFQAVLSCRFEPEAGKVIRITDLCLRWADHKRSSLVPPAVRGMQSRRRRMDS